MVRGSPLLERGRLGAANLGMEEAGEAGRAGKLHVYRYGMGLHLLHEPNGKPEGSIIQIIPQHYGGYAARRL